MAWHSVIGIVLVLSFCVNARLLYYSTPPQKEYVTQSGNYVVYVTTYETPMRYQCGEQPWLFNSTTQLCEGASPARELHCDKRDYVLPLPWYTRYLRFAIINETLHINKSTIRSALKEVISLFQNHTPLRFKEVTNYNDADIKIMFAPLDNDTLTIGELPLKGKLIINSAKQFDYEPNQEQLTYPLSRNLKVVLLHGLGHVIGLTNVNQPNSTTTCEEYNPFSLSQNDLKHIDQLYGEGGVLDDVLREKVVILNKLQKELDDIYMNQSRPEHVFYFSELMEGYTINRNTGVAFLDIYTVNIYCPNGTQFISNPPFSRDFCLNKTDIKDMY